jgi:hypothetical protein
MRKVREVLRLTASGRSTRQIGIALGVASGSVVGYLQRARAVELTWERVSNPKPLLVNNTPDDISPHSAPCAESRHSRSSGTTWATLGRREPT